MSSLIGPGAILLVLFLLAVIMGAGCKEDETDFKKDTIEIRANNDRISH